MIETGTPDDETPAQEPAGERVVLPTEAEPKPEGLDVKGGDREVHLGDQMLALRLEALLPGVLDPHTMARLGRDKIQQIVGAAAKRLSSEGGAARELSVTDLASDVLEALGLSDTLRDRADEGQTNIVLDTIERAKAGDAVGALADLQKAVKEGRLKPGIGLRPIKKQGEQIGRNDKCPCGSGQKYKNCCLRKKK